MLSLVNCASRRGIWTCKKKYYELAKYLASSTLKIATLMEMNLFGYLVEQIIAMRKPGVMEALTARDVRRDFLWSAITLTHWQEAKKAKK